MNEDKVKAIRAMDGKWFWVAHLINGKKIVSGERYPTKEEAHSAAKKWLLS